MESELREETEKWLERIKKAFSSVKASNRNERYIENVKAYIADSEYFLGKGDLIRAFEAVIWAWAWLEIGKEIGVVKEGSK
ncbi:MAG TPA: DUF357 domain-containing protein [Candidatus Aenigmarchaeota archaeon]|nr:DUF357 domain-containing protein [Candidatus Aenigmarchaeota archaeon]